MYSVTGRVGAVAYTAVVGDRVAADHPAAAGIVTGSPVVLDLLRGNAGKSQQATPTGPAARLDLSDEASVFIALLALTRVIRTDGEVPDLLAGEDEAPAGAVY